MVGLQGMYNGKNHIQYNPLLFPSPSFHNPQSSQVFPADMALSPIGHTVTHFEQRIQFRTLSLADSDSFIISIPEVPFTTGTSSEL